MRVVAESRKGKVATVTGGNERPNVDEAIGLVKTRLGWTPDHGEVRKSGNESYVRVWSDRK